MAVVIFASPPAALRTGIADHAFDHLGAITDLAGAATASGANIIYCNGIGPAYLGLPTAVELTANRNGSLAYLRKARAQGVRLAIGYVCATSIVKLETFDKNWTLEFRARFRSPPAQWRQLGKDGQPLPSWYPAPYEAACMNNPDWRTYEKFVVREQLESGCDGIFFDNPTVHPNGCYCHFCMEKFEAFLADKHKAVRSKKHPLELLRQWAVEDPAAFLEFRAMIAADFLGEMRTYARSVKSGALVTCNNSLNSPDVLSRNAGRWVTTSIRSVWRKILF